MTGLDLAIKRFRLACSVPHPDDGTSFYRAMGPLGSMLVEEPRLDLVLPRRAPSGGWDLSWDWLATCHALFLQRPYKDVHLQLVKYAKAMGLPVWVDWDDDQRAVPRSNPFFPDYADQDEIRKVYTEICDLADVVTASTSYLARHVSPKARVLPNAHHFKFYNEKVRRVVSWRGAAGHVADMDPFLRSLSTISRLPQFSLWQWFFMGDVPWKVEETIAPDRLTCIPAAMLHFMVPLLALQAPFVHIVPLLDGHFNRCKSNIAWIEATCAGAVVLAPDTEEWRQPGVLTYTTPADFGEKLRWVMGTFVEERSQYVEASRKHITENLTLAKVNQIRWEILNELWIRRRG